MENIKHRFLGYKPQMVELLINKLDEEFKTKVESAEEKNLTLKDKLEKLNHEITSLESTLYNQQAIADEIKMKLYSNFLLAVRRGYEEKKKHDLLIKEKVETLEHNKKMNEELKQEINSFLIKIGNLSIKEAIN